MSAWHKQKLADFADSDSELIVNRLATAGAERNLEPNRETIQSWRRTVEVMGRATDYWLRNVHGASEWTILFEYELPRRTKRIDIVVLARDVIGLMEFKVGAVRFDRGSRWQTKQYALDIRDFHKFSRDRRIAPFLVATGAQSSGLMPTYAQAVLVSDVNCVSENDLASRFADAFKDLNDQDSTPIEVLDWDTSPYQPTPWIIAAAQAIFQNHDVREIRLAESHNIGV